MKIQTSKYNTLTKFKLEVGHFHGGAWDLGPDPSFTPHFFLFHSMYCTYVYRYAALI